MKQQISECMDGELDAQSAARILGQLANSTEFHADWVLYHMIGDGMRDAPDLSPAFAARLSERLAAEPTVLAPRRMLPARGGFAQVARYAAAALAAVAVVGWFAVTPRLSPTAPQLAQQTMPEGSASTVALQRPAISPLKPRDHDYMMAHQAVSPGGAMQGVAPYVRTVSFGTEANDR
jgi:sigma-E factor negative regulatory protein RseA